MQKDLKISPKNILEWSDFEDWVNGTSSAPTEWVLAGTGAAVAREATIVNKGTYSVKLTRGSANLTLSHSIPTFADYSGKRVTFGCWVYASAGSTARLQIDDGVGTTESSYHSGTAGWEFLTVTHDVDQSNTELTVVIQNNSGTEVIYGDDCILVEGEKSILEFSSTYAIEKWTMARRKRVPKYTAGRREGVIIPEDRFAEVRISLRGSVNDYSSVATARNNFDNFKRFLLKGEKDLYLYDDRFYRGFITDFNSEYIPSLLMMKWNANVVCQIPFSRSIGRRRDSQTISSSPTTYTITNNGENEAIAVVTVKADQGGDVTSCVLENITLQQNMSYAGTVSSGDELIIDTENTTVENNGQDDISNHTGDFITLAAGQNTLKFTGSNCTIDIDWYERFA